MCFFKNETKLIIWKRFEYRNGNNFVFILHLRQTSIFPSFFFFIIIIIPKLFSKFYKEPKIHEYRQLIFSFDIKWQYEIRKIWNRKFLLPFYIYIYIKKISQIPIVFLLTFTIIFCSFRVTYLKDRMQMISDSYFTV